MNTDGDVSGTFVYGRRLSVDVSKRVNGGPWLLVSMNCARDDAERVIAENRAFHHERCPRDIVEYQISD